MIVGYARVSTDEQDLSAQLDALKASGCDRIFSDKASGRAGVERLGLVDAIKDLSAGDSLVVWSLDRLGRSLAQLVLLLDELQSRAVQFRSLKESIDTTSAAGRLQVHMLAALAEFERARIAERTLAGLAAARKRGRVGGRPSALTKAKLEAAKRLLDDENNSMSRDDVARAVGVSRATLYRHIPAE